MKKYFKNTFLLYTCSFLLLLPIVFLPFILKGKSFVWDPDGISQHYPALIYYGKILRKFLSGKGFSMVDFKIGLGFDTLTTLNYYVIGDPIALLAVFMTAKNGVFMYNLLILIRFYLVGISFILLMKYMKKDGLGAALGALIYVFCGYTLFAGVRHPFFINPMIYLPLLIIGVEQVLRKKKPYLFILMTFISVLSNFYFFYVLTIMVVVYIMFRYFYCYRKNYKNIFTGLIITGLKTGGYYILGTAMAAAVFLPILYAFSLNGRLGSKPKLITGYLFYNGNYYLNLFQGLFASGVFPDFWVTLSFSSVTILSFVILFCNKKYRQLKFVMLLTFCGLLVPSFAYFMNDFSYIANRWDFLVSLVVAMTFAVTYEKLFQLSNTEKIISAVLLAVYGVLAFVFISDNSTKYEFYFLLFTVLMVLILQTGRLKEKKRLQEIVLYALVFITLGIHGYINYGVQIKTTYVDEFLSKKQVTEMAYKGELNLIPKIKDNSFYRIEKYGSHVVNEALTVGYHDVSSYYSLMDGEITDNLKELELRSQKASIYIFNMDNRTILDELSSVKYFVSTDDKTAPYGYDLIKEKRDGFRTYYLYKNRYALPLGYVYDNYIPQEEYNNLSALQKQNIMMSAVVLDKDYDYAEKTTTDADQGIEKLNADITTDGNVELTGNTIIVKKGGAAVTLQFFPKPDTETYVRLGNLNIDEKVASMMQLQVIGNNLTDKPAYVRSIYNNSYFGQRNFLINTGYSKTGETRVTISFPQAGTYSYDSLDVYSVDMNYYKKEASALKETTLKNIKMDNNLVKGTITLEKKGILELTIPYSKGWSAYVDGKKTELLRGNVMYMALPLTAGKHHIVLRYMTPLLKEGFFISVAAFIIFVVIIVFYESNFIRKIVNRKRINFDE